VGEHVQCHFGGDLRQTLHQEVSSAHSHLQRAERMLDRLAALTHRLRIFVKPPLSGFQQCSCSQRGMRRSLPVVHFDFSGQFGQAFVQ
jgi:hypothetical protein